MSVIKLPIYDIEIDVENGGGTIRSNFPIDSTYDGMESFILACACSGVDVTTPEFINAIVTATDAIENNS